MRKVVIAVALALSLGACESAWMKAYGPNFPPPEEGEAALYIVRTPAPADASLIPMTMNSQPVGALSAATWMRFDVLPDLYNIRVHGRQASSDLIVTVMPGESRFLLLEPTPEGSARLKEIRQADGRRLVRAGQPTAIAYR